MGVIIRNGVLYPGGGGANADIIAPTFDTATDYYAGQCVIYQNQLYQFHTSHYGAWSNADATSIDMSTLTDGLANSLVEPFDKRFNYNKGDFVIYEGTLYEFISNHPAGDFDLSKAVRAYVINLLEDVCHTIGNYYDEEETYRAGDLVDVNMSLFMITDDISEMSWDDVIANNKAQFCTVADVFDMYNMGSATRFTQATQLTTSRYFEENHSYAIGDIVLKYDSLDWRNLTTCELYRFTSAHTAGDPWDDSEVEQITVVELIDEVNAPTFSEAVTRTNITSGDKLSTLFGKIKKWFTDLKNGAFMDVHITADVTALAGATTVAVTDDSISSTSMIEVFTENQSNKQISVTNYTISNHTVTLTFAALAEDTVFNIRVTNT